MNIGGAAKASGVSAKMIRYYESIGLVPAAARSGAGYRSYGETEVQMLRFVRRARDLGFGLERIAELLALWRDRDRHSADVKRLAEAQVEGLTRRIAEMQAMADTLRHLAQACCGDERPDCPILADLGAGTAQPPPDAPVRGKGRGAGQGTGRAAMQGTGPGTGPGTGRA